MTKKSEELEVKVATATGWADGHRIRRGDTFTAPKNFEGRWFKPADSKDERVQDALREDSNILAVKPAGVKAWAASATSDEINKAISVEQGSGSPRKNVLNMLQDELANRVGRTGGPDPAAKDIHEKDPIVGAGEAADEVFD